MVVSYSLAVLRCSFCFDRVITLAVGLRCPKRADSAGKTSKVSSVALIKPPITTVARGFCTSAPVPVARAAYSSPKTRIETR
jgi:hypothetical protein